MTRRGKRTKKKKDGGTRETALFARRGVLAITHIPVVGGADAPRTRNILVDENGTLGHCGNTAWRGGKERSM